MRSFCSLPFQQAHFLAHMPAAERDGSGEKERLTHLLWSPPGAARCACAIVSHPNYKL